MTFPANVPVCLSKLSELTSWGESTLRDAALSGELKATKKGGKWCATLDAYCEWVKAGSGRGKLGDASKRQGEADRPEGRETAQGTGRKHQDRGKDRVGKAPRKAKRRKPTLVIDIRDELEGQPARKSVNP